MAFAITTRQGSPPDTVVFWASSPSLSLPNCNHP